MKASSSQAAAGHTSAAHHIAERPLLKEVRLTLQPMLRIQSCSLEDCSCVVKGELMGLEIEPGVLEITNCYSCQNISPVRTSPSHQPHHPGHHPTQPADSSTEQTAAAAAAAGLLAGQRDTTAREEKSLEKFRSKLRDLYDSTDADPQALGIWTNECPTEDSLVQLKSASSAFDPLSSNALNSHLLEELYERCLTLEPNTILLTFDVTLYQVGEFAYRAYRLGAKWYSLRHQLDRGEVDKASYLKALTGLDAAGADLLEPVVCRPSLTPYDQAAALICHPSAEARLQKDRRVQEAMLQARERELTKINYAIENVISTN